ncbi:hypothetical protein UVI_02024120 [Ustilaginoidea virens]|uniref:Uncharacterized protein n=1 Tax=Ustilaginoidea virens TaxID=1159556 RepID=A0A1B5L2Z9_USTVR|nr:hypothetical protein UVI_02024120 [Ustilaginoidea virens]
MIIPVGIGSIKSERLQGYRHRLLQVCLDIRRNFSPVDEVETAERGLEQIILDISCQRPRQPDPPIWKFQYLYGVERYLS